MKTSLVISLFLIFMISGCKCSKGQVDGGPCSYENKICPAEVIDIYKTDSTYSDIWFIVKNCDGTDKDTITYSGEFGMYINSDSLVKNEIKIGSRYKYLIRDIQSGHCSPHIERLVLERFE